jgi:Cu2+-exporting ATPase
VTFVVWTAIGDTTDAVERSITVLVIACPHALGLAIPLVISISTGVAARSGILVKDRLALEAMRMVDTVLFDKTGTLKKGPPAMSEAAGIGIPEDEMLRLAAAVEANSEHPLGRAIVAAAAKTGEVPAASGFRSLSGRGVAAAVEGSPVEVAGPARLRERELEAPKQIAERLAAWRKRGATVLFVVRDGRIVGAIEAEDEIRPESAEAVRALQREGVRSVMITGDAGDAGDAGDVAEAVASEIGIDDVIAEVLPENKAGKVAELQREGRRVAMVGDGVNDAPALAQADVGIAIGAGTDVAIESAGVVLVSDDPRGVVGVRRLSRASYRKMVENLAWAVGYNIVAIPLAAGVLAGAGVVPPPAAGAIAMSVSTVVVAVNALTLRRLDFDLRSPDLGRPGGADARASVDRL